MGQMSFPELYETAYRLINASDVNLFNAVVKLSLSAVVGGVIGYERKGNGQSAGVRTFSMISAGAALAMIISIYIPQQFFDLKNGDPGRIAAQVITGIGFLGAGAIIRTRGAIKGLTTAAGIWMTAMIGMAIGAGLYLVGIIAAALTLVIFVCFSAYEQRAHLGWTTKVVKMEFAGCGFDAAEAEKLLKAHNIRIVDVFMRQDFSSRVTVVSYVVMMKPSADLGALFDAMRALGGIKSVSLDSDFKI